MCSPLHRGRVRKRWHPRQRQTELRRFRLTIWEGTSSSNARLVPQEPLRLDEGCPRLEPDRHSFHEKRLHFDARRAEGSQRRSFKQKRRFANGPRGFANEKRCSTRWESRFDNKKRCSTRWQRCIVNEKPCFVRCQEAWPIRNGARPVRKEARPPRKDARLIGKAARPRRNHSLSIGKAALPRKKRARPVGKAVLPTRNGARPTGREAPPARKRGLPVDKAALKRLEDAFLIHQAAFSNERLKFLKQPADVRKRKDDCPTAYLPAAAAGPKTASAFEREGIRFPHQRAGSSGLLQGASGARRAVRWPLLRGGDLDRNLLPPGLPRPARQVRELPVLPVGGRSPRRRLSSLPALPARDSTRCRLVARHLQHGVAWPCTNRRGRARRSRQREWTCGTARRWRPPAPSSVQATSRRVAGHGRADPPGPLREAAYPRNALANGRA